MPTPTQKLQQRRRRLLGAVPATLAAWGVLAGLPFTPAGPRAGAMHTEIVTLSGPDGERTASAFASSAKALRTVPDEAAPGWSASVDVDDGTQAVAASWKGAATGAVEVRGRAGDTWGPWTTLQADPEEAPDDATRDSGGMAWFGTEGVDEVQVKVATGSLEDLELQSMQYDAPSSSGVLTAVAGASAAQPAIQPRSAYTTKGWATANSGCASGPIMASGGVKYAVVHHTVNSNTYAASDVPAMMAAIYTYHTGTNGWCDIGYNFIIDRFGTIWEARSGGVANPVVGGHAAGFNTGSMGVSFLGQYEPGASPTAVQPSSAALNAAANLIGWKLSLNDIDPTGTVSVSSGGSNKWPAGTVLNLNRIIGHRDVGLTACPGQNLYSRLADIRTMAKTYQGTATTTTTSTSTSSTSTSSTSTSSTSTSSTTTTTSTTLPPGSLAPFTSASTLVTQQYQDLLRRPPTADELALWTPRIGITWTPEQFVEELLTSEEADTRVHAVTRLYQAYFLRLPDHNGFTYWMNRRGEGRTLISISTSFATSSEFTRRYGALTNEAFVNLVYTNVLGRPADESGSTYWTSRLDAGMSRGQVMTNFSQSTEYVRKTTNGINVVGTYEGMLQRSVDADTYTLFVAGLNSGGTTLNSIISFVWDGAEYQTRIG